MQKKYKFKDACVRIKIILQTIKVCQNLTMFSLRQKRYKLFENIIIHIHASFRIINY